MKEYCLSEGISLAERVALFNWLMKMSAEFKLIQRDGAGLNGVPFELTPLLINTARVTQWPGTQLHSGGGATAYTFRPRVGLNFDFFSLPGELEDISFYRSDGSLICGSVAHEGDVWLDLTSDEYKALSLVAPNSLVAIGL